LGLGFGWIIWWNILVVCGSGTVSASLDTPIPTYWISLENATDRRSSMEHRFASLTHKSDVVPHWIKATTTTEISQLLRDKKLIINGIKLLTEGEIQNNKTPLYMLHRKHLYFPQQVACLMSHLVAIEQAYRSGHKFALILEDDVILTDEWLSQWREQASNAPPDWEILQWITTNEAVMEHASAISEKWINTQPQHHSTAAYTISREGMQRVLKFTKGTDDGQLWNLREKRIVVADELLFYLTRSYTATNPLIRLDYRFNSTIRAMHRDYSSYDTLLDQKAKNLVGTTGVQKSPLLVITYLVLTKEDEIESASQKLGSDVHALAALHPGHVLWRVHVALLGDNGNSLREQFSNSCSGMDIDIHFTEHSERFNVYDAIKTALPAMLSVSHVLIKDQDFTLAGYAWASFLREKGSAVVATSLRENTDTSLIRAFNSKSKIGYLIHDGYFAKQLQGDAYRKLKSIPVQLTQSPFNLYDAKFAIWYFKKILSEETMELLNSQPAVGAVSIHDTIACGAAREWLKWEGSTHAREPCVLVPLVIVKRPARGAEPHAFPPDSKHIVGDRILSGIYPNWHNYSAKYRRAYNQKRFNKKIVTKFQQLSISN
jgi:GR25 family glycosyltransferase involved in LPS biosynthesis